MSQQPQTAPTPAAARSVSRADDYRFDQFGAPITHELDGVLYWGREGEAEALGVPLEQVTWSEEQLQTARKEAYQRQARVATLSKAADAIKEQQQQELERN